MRAVWLCVVLAAGAAGAAGPASAARAQDSMVAQDTAGAELLRVEIERRFAQRVQTDLGLSGDQMRRLKTTQQHIGPRRRLLMREGLGYRLALQSQMRPGVAANPDSVKAYMDGLQRVRAAQVALDEEEDKELQGYLTPVQRAQFHMMRTRLIQRANELRRERRARFGQTPPPGARRKP